MSKSYDKIIEQIGSLTVLELSELVKGLEEKFGVSASVSMGAAPSAAGAGQSAEAPKQEEKSEYKVTLKSYDEKEKTNVIKALRQVIPNIGLIDAKKMVEGAPVVIAEAASKDDAKKMKEVLEAAGAKVELA